MDKQYEKKYHDNEYTNWWFVSRRRAILRLLEKEPRKDYKILDIGCAGGPLIENLNKKGYPNVYGIDYSKEAVELCHSKGLKLVFCMDAQHLDFPENFFDIIISSDSLEHLEKENEAVASWYKTLKPNGKIFVFVPAFMSLWSEHDEVNMHYRRYTKQSLSTVLKENGFKIVRATYWNCLLFFPAILYRVVQRIKNKVIRKSAKQQDQLRNFSPVLNSMLTFWMNRVENPLFMTTGFPVGVSVFVSATKN